MEISVQNQILKLIPQIQVINMIPEEQRSLKEIKDGADFITKEKEVSSDTRKNESGDKIGRNDPCFCGSGKKYKNCHGK